MTAQMNNGLHLLATGVSSVAGFKYFFVGINHDQLAAVTSEQCYPDEERKAWTVKAYNPGTSQEEWPTMDEPLAAEIIALCRTQKCGRDIDWTNKHAIRDLYWEYKT